MRDYHVNVLQLYLLILDSHANKLALNRAVLRERDE